MVHNTMHNLTAALKTLNLAPICRTVDRTMPTGSDLFRFFGFCCMSITKVWHNSNVITTLFIKC